MKRGVGSHFSPFSPHLPGRPPFLTHNHQKIVSQRDKEDKSQDEEIVAHKSRVAHNHHYYRPSLLTTQSPLRSPDLDGFSTTAKQKQTDGSGPTTGNELGVWVHDKLPG